MTDYKFISLPRLTLMAAIGASLTACATAPQPHSSGFGKATAQNRSVHEVTPTAKQKNDTYIPADAARQGIARDKYRKNKSDKPNTVTTR